MKRILSIIILLCFYQINFAQNSEFELYSNGLIYDSNTITQLSQIVDSLNLKFKSCEITETYYAKTQTRALLFDIDKGDIKAIKKDIENRISPEELINRYNKNPSIARKRLIVGFNYKNYNEENITEVSSFSTNEDTNITIRLDGKINLSETYKKGDWIFDYYKGSDYLSESITAFYLLEDFNREKLKDAYAEMIQYADCMIDTTSSKIRKNAEEDYYELPSDYKKLSLKNKKKLLDKLRNTRVIGSCSMDNSPREHAVNIAKLSAETVNWEVFLKAHLDVMNDRFERVSDGNYAWNRRHTYLKELEVLDINTIQLLLGVSLRIENANENHYYGSISRLGRALSEAINREQFEVQITSMIKDNELDDYNRYLMYYLLDNYSYFLGKNKSIKNYNSNLLKSIKKELPSYLTQ